MTAATAISLDVPIVRQNRNAGCGLASLTMALLYHGVPVTLGELERHRLVRPIFLSSWGIGPGRIGRIALTFGVPVTIVDPSPRDVGRQFVRDGGAWRREIPSWRHIDSALADMRPVIACIPNKIEAFDGVTHPGSHWIVVTGRDARGEFTIHDPAPWRMATRCRPGYWKQWNCSMIVVGPPPHRGQIVSPPDQARRRPATARRRSAAGARRTRRVRGSSRQTPANRNHPCRPVKRLLVPPSGHAPNDRLPCRIRQRRTRKRPRDGGRRRPAERHAHCFS